MRDPARDGADGSDLAAPVYHALRFAAYTFYCVWAGMFATGLWVIAHECGHQAFSSSKQINNAVGWVLHSLLLVPYHSWRISVGPLQDCADRSTPATTLLQAT